MSGQGGAGSWSPQAASARLSPRAKTRLTHNWDRSSYTLGDAFGHIALGTDDIRGTVERIRAAGGKVVREPGPMKHGTTVIAFVEDPNGYRIELIERP